jgi:hypothetical protein
VSAWRRRGRRHTDSAPDPSRAYASTIKAVEDAATPVVLPNDQSATLGNVIAKMPDVPYCFALPRQRGDVTSQAVLLSMLSLLWNGQGGRHGGLPRRLGDDLAASG